MPGLGMVMLSLFLWQVMKYMFGVGEVRYF